jgi:subtilisin family serine protease
MAYNDNNPTDDLGHGTNVAGIIGANGNNGIGYAGLEEHLLPANDRLCRSVHHNRNKHFQIS